MHTDPVVYIRDGIFFSTTSPEIRNPLEKIPANKLKGEVRHLRILALGDSYTVGESLPVQDSYPFQLVRLLREKGHPAEDPCIIAATGWTTCDLQNALAKFRMEGDPFDWVNLLIGVNNQYQGRALAEYSSECTELLHQAIGLAGGQPEKVCVLSIPDYACTLFGRETGKASEISMAIHQYNEITSRIARSLGTHYLNITPESWKAGENPGLLAADGLHYSASAYKEWAYLLLELMLSPPTGRG